MKKYGLSIILSLLTLMGVQAHQVQLSGITSDEWDLEMTLWTDDNGITAGYAFLPEVRLVVGWWDTFPEEGKDIYGIRLTEFEPNGMATGTYLIHLRDAGKGNFTFVDGEMTTIDAIAGNHTMQLTDFTCRSNTVEPTERGPLRHATTGDLAESYEYTLPEQKGGFFEMMVLSDGTVMFDVFNRPEGDGVASAASDANRPGKIKGNVMEYPRVNDCGDTLRATFYRNFVVVETKPQPGPKHDCIPINAVFIKKQNDVQDNKL